MRWSGSILALVALLALQVAAFPRVRRQAELQDSENLTPLKEETIDDEDNSRDKRMLEGVTQAKWGAKNAILGFVFGQINRLIDTKTRLVIQLDKQNIAKNKQYGIEPPSAGGIGGLGNVFSSIIGPKLQLLGPKLNLITGAIGGLSGGGSKGGSSSSGSGSGGLGGLLSIFTGLSGSSSGGGNSDSGSLTITDSSDNNDDDDDDDDKDD